MAILSLDSGVIFKVDDYSPKCRALDLVICQTKGRVNRHLSPSHGVSFDGKRLFQQEDKDGLSIKILEFSVP